MKTDEVHVIHLRLARISDMFEMPQTDLFSEYRNFLTGVDLCLSELRSTNLHRPVRLEIELPPSAIDENARPERFNPTLRRYCDHRIRYDVKERRAMRLGGMSALRIGLPLAIVGLVLTAWSTHRADGSEITAVVDHIGWVLAWLGLWFPLDQVLFYPLSYRREERALQRLRDAEVVISAYWPA
jgi:hypothetical protein